LKKNILLLKSFMGQENDILTNNWCRAISTLYLKERAVYLKEYIFIALLIGTLRTTTRWWCLLKQGTCSWLIVDVAPSLFPLSG
jgi:hypothetical protein